MEEVLFYRGLRSKYNKALYGNGIYFATDTKEIIVNGVSYGSVDVDNELSATSINPVTSAAIYAGIQEQIDIALTSGNIPTKIQIRNEGNNQYRLYLLNDAGEEISKSDTTILGEQSSDIVLGGTFFTLSGSQDQQIKIGQSAKFSFYYDRRNDSGYSTATDAIVRVYKGTIADKIIIDEFKVSANSNFVVNIDEASTESKTIFTVELTPIEDGIELIEESKSIPVSVLVIDFSLLLNGYQLSNVYTIGNNINIPYIFTGYLGQKSVKVYVDGTDQDSHGNLYPEQIVTEGGTFVISTNGWSEGTHNIQLLASYESNNETIYSNLLYITVPVKSSVASFGTIFNMEGYEKPLIAGQLPKITVQQYQSFSFDFMASNNETNRIVEFYSQDVLISDYSISDSPVSLTYKYNNTGNYLCKLVCQGQIFSFNVDVVQSDYNIFVPNNEMLYLSALGKSNSSISRNVWSDGDITSTFEGFKWSGDGWQNVSVSEDITEPALRLIPGDKVTVNYKPLQARQSDAIAFNIKFKVSQAVDESETLISCLDENGRGFEIKTSEAYFKTYSGNTVSTKFAPGEIYNIGFVAFPELSGSDTNSKLNSRRVYLYVNGVICSTTLKGATDTIFQTNPKNITLQTNSSILDVFFIRVYEQQLSDSNMFDLYLIDLNNPKLLESEYKSNQVLNTSGNISVDKALDCGIPCMIITGEYEGLNAVDYVAAINNKNPKYDIDQILYLEKKEASDKNFVVIKGSKSPQLRLQGTSSLNYAIKNYRIYSKDAKLFLNCTYDILKNSIQEIEQLEANGTMTAEAEPKYALHDNSAPVNCWCLKADFAEASSSHNTGFARMVQDLLTNEKVNSLTPPQVYKSDDYPYEVRTTIDGHPCLLFARKTVNDTPVFAGKFNFNNDKSTEDVFGFLDVDGYHKNSEFESELATAATESLIFPEGFTSVTIEEGTKDEETFDQAGILKLLDGNPTECWEFLNNENSFGDFKDVDFTEKIITEKTEIDPETGKEVVKQVESLKWLNMWEARFPDEDGLNAAFEAGVQPTYLKATAEWIVSTNTEAATGKALDVPQYGHSKDTAEYRRAKFINEVSNYFDLTFLCDYYTLNDTVAGADQRKKNMMWAFWYNPDATEHEVMGKMRCYIIYYDNDTILGVDNSGAITVPWDADENTLTSSGSYVFAGHDSVLWQNLRVCFASELRDSYRKLRDVMNDSYMKEYFNEKQSEIYGEVVFNKDTYYKYVQPSVIGTPLLQSGVISNNIWQSQAAFVHGTRKAHRDWFIGKRTSLFDNKYATGTFTSNEIHFKGALDVSLGLPSLSLVSANDSYYAMYSDSGLTIDSTHTKIKSRESYSYTADAIPGPGATFKLYGISNMKELNLGTWGGFNDLYLGNCPLLEKLILGSVDSTSIKVVPLIGNNMPQLKYLDVSNIEGNASANPPNLFTELNVSNNLYLETLIAKQCPYLSTINFASGGNIKNMLLPKNFSNLYLDSLPLLTNSGIQWEYSSANVQQLFIKNCPNIDSIELLKSIMNSENSKLTHIRIADVMLQGNGEDLIAIKNRGIKGLNEDKLATERCKITGTYKLTTLLEDSLYKELCAYFDELDIQQPEYTIISFDLANSTPQKISNLDNSTGFKFGNTYAPSGHVKRILDQRHSYMVKSEGEGTFAAMQLSDSNSNFYNDGNPSLLNGTEGDYCMYEPHYWYKGINDYMNKTMYVLFSSNKECPKQANGLKVKLSDCTLHRGMKVNTSLSTNESNILNAVTSKELYNAYSYILPESHNYKQCRVASVANATVGSVIVSKDGSIIKKLFMEPSKGMHDNSYLFTDLPENAYKIYITVSSDAILDYAIYLTESSDLEAIEPDWVEHKECFVGRVMSTLYNNEVKSAIYSNANPGYSYYYPFDANGTAVTSICKELTNRGVGYYAADYEVLKDIIILAYAKYGGTDMHLSYVGAGYMQNGQPSFIPSYKPNADYLVYGIQDTKTSNSEISYDSYYEEERENIYPHIATLMGYHQFIGQGTIVSNNDVVNMSNKTYSNNRTGRIFKVYNTTTTKFNTFIMGGRYMDIFGIANDEGISTLGFCGKETGNSSAGSSFIEFGFKIGGSTTPVSYALSYTNGLNVNTSLSYSNLQRLQRILIVPTKINFYTDSNLYKGV